MTNQARNVPVGSPYRGKAPEPEKSIDLRESGAASHGTTEIDPATMRPFPQGEMEIQDPNPDIQATAPDILELHGPPTPTPPTRVQTSTPPAQPDLAAENAGLRQREGELIRAMGEQNRKFEEMLETQRLDMEIRSAGMIPQVAAPAPQQLPQGFNPEDTVTMGQVIPMLQNTVQMAQLQAIRATWDVTPEEENAVFQQYPQLANTPEPARTTFVQKAALMARKRASGSSPAAESPADNGKQATPPRSSQRPLTNVVPHVEAGHGAPSFPEPEAGANDAYTAATREYEEAKKIPNRRERHTAMKKAWSKILATQNISHEALSKSSFVVK
jgi:hypothetical protein